MKQKRKIPFLFKVIIFIIILGPLLQRASLIMQVWGTEQGEPDRRNGLFFTLPKNSVDCLLVGTSHIYCSLIPQQIYEETGLRSASIATSSQSYQNSYWLLKEALRKQKPKYVVMDIHSVTTAADDKVKDFRLHYTSGITIMPDLSLNKIKAYLDIKYHNTDWVENMSLYDAYGLLEYKSEYVRENYNIKTLWNLLIDPKKEYQTLGFYPTTSVYPMEELVPYITTEEYMNFYETQEYEDLCKIKSLLEENGVQLILVRAPYSMPDFDDKHLTEQAVDWAAKEKILYLDFFPVIEEIGIDLQTDFRDSDHLNQWGAKKATAYFSKYLIDIGE